ncbi:MAG: hypothetical protein Q7U51_06525 [Methanoregula sp.]|nr:hypothetical protein [Methanoregula sp.]
MPTAIIASPMGSSPYGGVYITQTPFAITNNPTKKDITFKIVSIILSL